MNQNWDHDDRWQLSLPSSSGKVEINAFAKSTYVIPTVIFAQNMWHESTTVIFAESFGETILKS
jgi:hypothetical protein